MKKYIKFQNETDRRVVDGNKIGQRMGCGWTDCTWSVPIPWQPVEAGWDIHYWHSDLLTGRPAAAEAQADAADAVLVLVASSRAHLPPIWLMVWLENWATNRRIVDSALAVIGDDTGDGSVASCFPRFSEFARRHGLTLFVRESAKNQLAFDFFARRFRGGSPLLSPASRNSKQAPIHATRMEWGINE
ncbi:MAG TPA: hypothetical protein VGN61_09585 [Verrucomicrobiae bacterium]